MTEYHVYVEDDSYVCTDHLIYQLELLSNRTILEKNYYIRPFRTGTFLFDGFDDSSTIMNKKVALAFAEDYPDNGFNCSTIFDLPINE